MDDKKNKPTADFTLDDILKEAESLYSQPKSSDNPPQMQENLQEKSPEQMYDFSESETGYRDLSHQIQEINTETDLEISENFNNSGSDVSEDTINIQNSDISESIRNSSTFSLPGGNSDENLDENVDENFPENGSENLDENAEVIIPLPKKRKRRKKLTPEQIRAIQKKKARKRAFKAFWHSFSVLRVILIIIISVFLSIKAIGYGSEFLGINQSSKLVKITIPEGATTLEIAKTLKNRGVIDTIDMFRIITKLKKAGANFQAGDHYVSANMGYNSIIDELTQIIERETVRISFPEGLYLYDAAKLLANNGVIGEITDATTENDKEIYIQNFLNAFNSYSNSYKFEAQLVSNRYEFYGREGYFFPDTYEFYKYQSADDITVVCTKIYDNFESKITPEMYTKMSTLGMKLDDVITLASIVQAEAPTAYEMTKVSSVFQNRLNNPEGIGRTQPYLESDPTSKYTNQVIRPKMDPGDERNKFISAYDTYESSGLPAGAICNPGIEAINAVLNPADTPYYYFVANIDTKETLYATTLEGQEANIEIIEQQYLDAESAE